MVPETFIIILVTWLNLSVLILSSLLLEHQNFLSGASIKRLSYLISVHLSHFCSCSILNNRTSPFLSCFSQVFPLARCPKSHYQQQQQHSIASLPQLTNFLWFHRRVSQHSCHCWIICTNLFSRALAVKVNLCWFMPGLKKTVKTINDLSRSRVDRCSGAVIQTVVIAPSMGAYLTLQKCELPQFVFLLFMSE